MVCDWNDQDFDFKKFKTQKIKFSFFKSRKHYWRFYLKKCRRKYWKLQRDSNVKFVGTWKTEKEARKKLWNWHIQKRMAFMYLIILLVILAIFSVTGVNLGSNMYCFELRYCMRTPQNLHLCSRTHICNPQGLDALVILMSTVFFLRISALMQYFQRETERMEQEWGFFSKRYYVSKICIIDRKNRNISDRIFENQKIKTSGGLTKSPCLF